MRRPRERNRGSRLLVNGLAWGVGLLGVWVAISVTLLHEPRNATPLTGVVAIVGGPSLGTGIRIAGSPPADLDMSEPETTAAIAPAPASPPETKTAQSAAVQSAAARAAIEPAADAAPVAVAVAGSGDDAAFAPFPAQVARAEEAADEPLTGTIPLPRAKPSSEVVPVPRARPRHVAEEVAALPVMTITDAEIDRHAPK